MGVGKSTTCKALYKRLYSSVWLDGDWCWLMNPWIFSDENKRMVEENIIYLLRNFLKNSSFEYAIFSWVMHLQEIFDRIIGGLSDMEYHLYPITLTCSPNALRERMLADGRGDHEIERSIGRLPLFQQLDTFKLDTTNYRPHEVITQIVEMVKQAPVIICDYDPTWPIKFHELKEVYQEALGDLIFSVEHVGSTSVSGLAAKPILDIDIVIESYKVFPQVCHILEKLGYIYEGERGIPDRHSFKRSDEHVPYHISEERWMEHHLYLCPIESLELKRHLSFRNYLRGEPQTMREYERLKRELAAKFRFNRDAYCNGKSQFIEGVLKNCADTLQRVEGARPPSISLLHYLR